MAVPVDQELGAAEDVEFGDHGRYYRSARSKKKAPREAWPSSDLSGRDRLVIRNGGTHIVAKETAP